MNQSLTNALNAVQSEFDKLEKQSQNLVWAKETAVRFQYELRAYIEGAVKRKEDPTKVLTEVLNKLIVVTPHGADMKVS